MRKDRSSLVLRMMNGWRMKNKRINLSRLVLSERGRTMKRPRKRRMLVRNCTEFCGGGCGWGWVTVGDYGQNVRVVMWWAIMINKLKYIYIYFWYSARTQQGKTGKLGNKQIHFKSRINDMGGKELRFFGHAITVVFNVICGRARDLYIEVVGDDEGAQITEDDEEGNQCS